MSGEDLKHINIKIEDKGATAQLQTAICNACKAVIKLDKNRYCVDCAVYMCDTCMVPHSTFPFSAGHTLCRSADDAGAQYALCGVHRSYQLKYFCVRCQLAMCAECQVQSHMDHQSTKIEEEVDRVRARLEKSKTDFEERISQERAYSTDMRKRMDEFLKVEQAVQLKLKQEYERISSKNAELSGKYVRKMRENIKGSAGRMTELQGNVTKVEKLLKDLTKKTKSDCLAVAIPTAKASKLASPPECPQLVQQIDQTLGKQIVNAETQTCADDIKTPDASAQISKPGSTDGKITYRLPNDQLIKFDQWLYSDEVVIAKIPWSIGVYRDIFDRLYVWLLSDRHKTLQRGSWEADTEFSLSVVHKNSLKTITKNFNHKFSSSSDWKEGYFVSLRDLAAGGYIIDGAITLEADVKVKSTRRVPS